MDMTQCLNILGLENSFTAAALRLAYNNYCRSNPPDLFFNDRYDESHSRESLEEMKSMVEMLMSSISHNEYEKQNGVKKTEEVSQVGVRIVNSIGLAMTYIKPGSFIMGSSQNGRRSIFLGKEQHVETLTKGFYLGIYPITQFQWQRVMGTHLQDPIILFGIIFLLNFQAFGQDWTAAQKEVWEVVVADFEKFKQGDLEGILASRHDDVLIWWGEKPIPYDKKLSGADYGRWFSYDIPTKWELEPLAIKVIGNVASVFYTYKYSGNVLSGRGRDLETWIKQDNKWIMINSFGASCDKLPPCK
jgi:hypothetical protein